MAAFAKRFGLGHGFLLFFLNFGHAQGQCIQVGRPRWQKPVFLLWADRRWWQTQRSVFSALRRVVAIVLFGVKSKALPSTRGNLYTKLYGSMKFISFSCVPCGEDPV